MSSEKPKDTLTTPLSETEVEIYEWLSGSEAKEVDKPLKDNAKGDVNRDGSMNFQLKKDANVGQIMDEVNERQIKHFVASVDGEEDGVYEAVMNLPEKDVNFLLREIQKRRADDQDLAKDNAAS